MEQIITLILFVVFSCIVLPAVAAIGCILVDELIINANERKKRKILYAIDTALLKALVKYLLKEHKEQDLEQVLKTSKEYLKDSRICKNSAVDEILTKRLQRFYDK